MRGTLWYVRLAVNRQGSAAQRFSTVDGFVLESRLPINDLSHIYEAFSLQAKNTQSAESLIETARASLGPAVAARHVENGTLHVIVFDPMMLEQSLLENLRPGDQETHIVLDVERLDALAASLRTSVEAAGESGITPVLVCAPALRPAVKRMLASGPDGLPVLNYNEATEAQVPIDTVGVVRAEPQRAV